MFIGDGLAAYTYAHDHGLFVINVHAVAGTSDGFGPRQLYAYTVHGFHRGDDQRGYGLICHGDLRSGVGQAPDCRRAMAALVGFLAAEAERYAGSGRYGTCEPAEPYGWDVAVAEWAYQNDAELQVLSDALDLAHR